MSQGKLSVPEGLDMEEWKTFKETHQKNYADAEEENMRMKIYMESKERVAKHNADFEKGITTYKMGINHFADMTAEERKRHC